MFKSNRIVMTVVVAALGAWFLGANVAQAGPIIIALDAYPVVPAQFVSENSTGFATIDIEILSMQLRSVNPVNVGPPPPPGSEFVIDSFFDVFFEVEDSNNNRAILTPDIDYQVGISNTSSSDTSNPQTFDTEILSMSLSSNIAGIPIIIREDPNRPSLGQREVTDLSNGTFQVDSFFDVFFEVSLGGGPFLPAANAMHMEIAAIPLPAAAWMALPLLGGLGVAGAIRRRRRAA